MSNVGHSTSQVTSTRTRHTHSLLKQMVQWPGRFLGTIGRHPSVSMPNRLHDVMFRFSFDNLRYIYSTDSWKTVISQTQPAHHQQVSERPAVAVECDDVVAGSRRWRCRSQSLLWATGGKLCRKAQEKEWESVAGAECAGLITQQRSSSSSSCGGELASAAACRPTRPLADDWAHPPPAPFGRRYTSIT